MIERFRAWFEYEVEAHRRVLASLESVPREARGAAEYAKALAIFAHVLAARRLWLSRFGVIDEPEELFPAGADADALEAIQSRVASEWRRWLRDATDDDLGRTFRYTAHEGGEYESTYEEILTQLFGHSWYHRGQIASLVRSCGGEPAVTDYVYATRRPVEDASGRPS